MSGSEAAVVSRRVAFAWQLGAGLGHLARVGPLASRLAAAGHDVTAFVPDGERAKSFLPHVSIQPMPAAGLEPASEPATTFADVLIEAGWGDREGLARNATRWQGLLADVAPDAIVFDHAPTALLAAQTLDARRVLLGTGFAQPPDVSPLPRMRPDGPSDALLAEREAAALEAANAWLAAQGAQPLPRVSALFARGSQRFIAGVGALDHYGERVDADYLGAWPAAISEPPRWPAGEGPRVFAYLKVFPALPAVVEILARSGLPSLIVLDGAPAELAARLARPSVRVQVEPVSLADAAREAAFAITHAGHGASGVLLAAGTPILTIPLVVEQFMVARRIVALGAGLLAASDSPAQMIAGFKALAQQPAFATAAQRFARDHPAGDPEESVVRVSRAILGVG